MQFVSHHLIKSESIEERPYQKNILQTAIRKNTLCVLPTGTGKTAIAILLAAERLDKYPDSKILILAPTRPLCAQHQKSFQDSLNFPEEYTVLLTGKIPPSSRAKFYKTAKIISATPQTIQHDIDNGICDLSDFSLLVVDECHRSIKKYAYPTIAGHYNTSAQHPRILGLTASPGSTETAIKEICKNLFIDAVEIRTDADADIKPYLKEVNIEWVKLDLPDAMKKIQENLKVLLKERLDKLRNYNILVFSKRDVIDAQKRISGLISTERKPIYYQIIMLLAQTMKIWHSLELLETQSISAVNSYFEKLRHETSRSSKILSVLLRDQMILIDKLYSEGFEHPKINKLKEIVSEEIENKNEIKIIIFSHYRDNINLIKKVLEKLDGCKPVILVGQSGESGLTQKEQISIIRDYDDGFYNCLITSPIGEEGLHIPSADLAIFYEPVPSEIRTIQRRGRVGRTKVGKIIFLLTKKTRDEGYYWASQRKEAKMKTILREMQNKNPQTDLEEFF